MVTGNDERPFGGGRSMGIRVHFSKIKNGTGWQPLPANSKDSQAQGEVLLSIVFFQHLSTESAFPDNRSKAVCGRDHIRAFSAEQTRS